MEVKPGYKQTEVGDIPEEWDTPKVGDVCGCIVPGRNKPQLFGGDIPWITTPDLENGRLVTTSRLGLCISKAEAQSVGSRIVPPGSVLMSCAGELGIVAMSKNEIVVNQQLHVFIPTARIDAVFLLNALIARKGQIESTGTKTAVPYLNKSACNSIIIPLPPSSEQHAIAKALSDVDGLLGGLDRLIAKKRDLKQAAMQQLLTGQTRLPGFRGEWEVSTFAKVVRHHAGNSALIKGKLAQTPATGLYPGFSASGQDVWCERYEFEGDAIIVSAVGSRCGKAFAATGKWCAIANTHVVWPNETKVDRRFLGLFINDEDFWLKSGSGQPFVLFKQTFTRPMRLPSLPEQTAIAEVLTAMDAELTALEQRREKTRALKQAMMQELLTGRTRLV